MDKTKALIISPKLNKTVENIPLSINNFPIQIVNLFKYLGVILLPLTSLLTKQPEEECFSFIDFRAGFNVE